MLTSIIGGYAGIFSAGELHEIWQNLLIGRPCGWGRRLDRCRVWGPILEEVRESALTIPWRPADAVRWRSPRSARVWHTDRILRQNNRPGPTSSRYATSMSALYAIVAQCTGSRVVVDSTKIPSDAALLTRMHHLSPYVLHLIRDLRATAYSWSRQKTRFVPGGWEEKLTETHALSSGLQWLGYNLFTERVFRHRRGGWSRLRYEDFVADPQAHADAITSWLEVDPNDGPFEGPDLVCLAGRHMIAGNPDRFDADAKRTRRDDRWLERIRRRDRWIATALALPLLHKYGYRIRRAAAREYVSALPSS